MNLKKKNLVKTTSILGDHLFVKLLSGFINLNIMIFCISITSDKPLKKIKRNNKREVSKGKR